MNNRYFLIPLTALLLAFTSSASVYGQGYGNAHPHDFKPFNLGFLMGFNYNMYNLKSQSNVVDDNIFLERIRVIERPGITLGMITNLNLQDNVALRFIPQVSLEQRDFEYKFRGGEGRDSIGMRKIEASYLNLPILFQFKTKYYRRYRVYVLLGGQVGLNLASAKRVRDDPNLLKIQSQDYSIVVGTGMMLYGDRLKVSPELRYSFGLTNIYVPEFTSHAAAISQLFSQVLTLNINFE
ncbi:MAG: porin family protein [Bacteroidota bacterium]